MFGPDDQQRLLTVARLSLEARVRGLPGPVIDTAAPLDLPRGAFVSIHRGMELRGCLGRITADWAVGRVVAHLAQAVSDSDPRFQPVAADELDHLDVEISVLTPDREGAPHEIKIGRHGLIVEHGRKRGLLLPQVAVQHGWDAVTFLQHTCLKAGLPPDAWQRDARLRLFEAHVFSESSPSQSAGPVPS